MQKRAAIYARISDDRDGEGLGVGRQEADCRRLAETLGWEVVAVHTDNSVSAYSGKKRPGYEALLNDLKNGVADALIVWKPDRLHRRPIELEGFIDLVEQHGTTIATVAGGSVDLTTSEGRAMARVIGAFARMESEVKSDRIRRKHLQLAADGAPGGGGTRPFGYLADRVTIDKHEAPFIREACRRLLDGETLHGVASDWQARGVPTASGRPWRSFTLKRVVTSARICGWREHKGQMVAPSTVQPIVDRETVERLRSILNDPSRLARTAPIRRYLLTGLLYCGRCGEVKMIARPKDDKRRQYVCSAGANFSGCGKLGSLAEPLEREVAERIFLALDSHDYAAAFNVSAATAPTMANPAAEILLCEAKLKDLARMFAKDEITRAEWLESRRALELRLDAARRAGTAARSAFIDAPGSGDELAAEWSDLPLGTQRAHVERLVESVVLMPAVKGRNFFDPSRVKVNWRF